ncbi:hypothetical protein C8R43DRAFT_133510 [Mycena crocata]|nr:hypothetical protein C8R43DRAFT_133510 [Mycena crocata]
MSLSDRLPNELLLEVFTHLPQTDLKPVSSTCHTFWVLSRPTIFSHFRFNPNAGAPYRFRLNTITPKASYVQKLTEGLEFWCSDTIAPFVRTCEMLASFVVGESPTVLRDIFFDRLPSFTGLRRFRAVRISFTQSDLLALGCLSTLTDLDIEECDIQDRSPTSDATPAEIASPHTLCVSAFTFTTTGYTRPNIEGWLLFLSPDHLRKLSVVCESSRFQEAMEARPAFTHVTSLRVPIKTARDLATLSKFPAVETFFSTAETDMAIEALGNGSHYLPALKEYTGSYFLLHLFLSRVNLTRISIDNCSLYFLLAHLQHFRTPNNITSLDVALDSLDYVAFGPLFEIFSHICTLRLRANLKADLRDDDLVITQPMMLLKILANLPTLPPTLQRVALGWFRPNSLAQGAPSVSEFASLCNTISSRCPSLTTLWLDGQHFLFRWRTQGRWVEEAAALNTEDAEFMREKFLAFWDTSQ